MFNAQLSRHIFGLLVAGLALLNLALCLFWQQTSIHFVGLVIPRIPLNEALGGVTIALVGGYFMAFRASAKAAGIFLGIVGLLVSIQGIFNLSIFAQ